MTCSQIEEDLPAYLEDVLSPQEKQGIQEHLLACENCSRVLADLKAMGKLLKGIEEVEPPPWLKAKIMSRVKEEVNWKVQLCKRLFEPFHIKVPIQIFATVLIAVLAYSVYMKEEPELKRFTPPLPPAVYEAAKGQSAAVASRKVPETSTSAPSEKGSPSLKDQAITDKERTGPSPSASPEQEVRLGDLPARNEVALEASKAASPIGSQEEKDVVPAGDAMKTARQDRVESRKAVEAIRGSSQARNLQKEKAYPGAAVREGGKHESGLSGSTRMTSIAAENIPSFEVTLLVRDRDTAIREIERFVAGFNGRLILRQSGTEKAVLTMEIPGKNVILFLEKLKALGEMKRKDTPLDFSAGPVTVRVEITSPS